MRPNPALEQEAEFREMMQEESPDGRPPTAPARRESRILFFTVLVLVTAAVIAALTWQSGSIVPGLIALGLMIAFIVLAAWPTWNAGVDRTIEERHVADELRSGKGPAGRPT
jgi:hypothetical protein